MSTQKLQVLTKMFYSWCYPFYRSFTFMSLWVFCFSIFNYIYKTTKSLFNNNQFDVMMTSDSAFYNLVTREKIIMSRKSSHSQN